ncbi:hypothetical protein AB0G74_30040 [Streptomyces sp. NPDC020875]|uniref:hypothetical protein n=1 Tax=Streptomyces sp. NPDC020875 TaxID=3154898 RepID=UPI0033F49CD2
MSIRAGRVFLAVVCAVFVVCLAWFGLMWLSLGAWSDGSVAPMVLALVAAVAMIVGVPLCSNFVEADIDGGSITLRYVLRRRRVIPVSKFDEVVLLQALRLPALTRVSEVPRVVLRGQNTTVGAFTPRDGCPVEELRTLGFEPVVIRRQLSPFQAWRHYRKSVSLSELLIEPLLWASMGAPVIIVVWLLWEAAKG